MSGMISKNGLQVGIESSDNTRLPTLSASGTFVLSSGALTPTLDGKIETITEYSLIRGTQDVVNHLDFGSVGVSVESPATASDETANPSLDVLLRMCGLKKTTVGDVITYTPSVSGGDNPTASFDIVYLDRSLKAFGARASMSFSAQIGQHAKFSFELMGSYYGMNILTTGENSITYATAGERLTLSNATVITVGGTAIKLSEFSFDMNGERQHVPFVGGSEVVMQDIAPKCTIKAKLDKYNAAGWTEFLASTEVAIVLTLKDRAGATKMTLTIPKAKLAEVPLPADTSGIYTVERQYICRPSTGNDNFALEWHQ